MPAIRVLIVDDAVVVRRMLSDALTADPALLDAASFSGPAASRAASAGSSASEHSGRFRRR